MSPRLRIFSLIWVSVAILLRVYGSAGGDASIVGGMLFLAWTAPFGLIWQFKLENFAVTWFSVPTAQTVGDIIVIATGFLFWFVFFPKVRNYIKLKRV